MNRGGRRVGAGRPRKKSPTDVEWLYVGTSCVRLAEQLILQRAARDREQQFKKLGARENYIELRRLEADAKEIPVELRKSASNGRRRKPKPGSAEARDTVEALKETSKSLLHDLGRRKRTSDGKYRVPKTMKDPPVVHIRQFPRGYRRRIIMFVQWLAFRRIGKRFSQNEVAAAWAFVRKFERVDEN